MDEELDLGRALSSVKAADQQEVGIVEVAGAEKNDEEGQFMVLNIGTRRYGATDGGGTGDGVKGANYMTRIKKRKALLIYLFTYLGEYVLDEGEFLIRQGGSGNGEGEHVLAMDLVLLIHG